MEYYEGRNRDRGAPGSADWTERLLAQAILASSSSREEMTQARQTRAEAERYKQEAEAETAKAIEEIFATVKAQAQRILEEAVAIRTEAETDRVQVAQELERTATARQEAESYSRQLEEEARERSELARQETVRQAEEQRAAIVKQAEDEAEDLRWRIGEEMQKIMKGIASLRSAAQEELEAQRLLTEAVRIKALGPTLRTQLSVEPVPASHSNGHGSALATEVVTQAVSRGRGRPKKHEAEAGES